MEATSNCCLTPTVGRGTALVASVATLDAIGPQDKYLLSNNSEFIPTIKRSAPNVTFQRTTQFGEPTTTYFGNTVKHVFKPREMGDLLSNMYLKTRTPSLVTTTNSLKTTEIPGTVCHKVPIGESIEIIESEIQRIQLSSSNLLPYTELAKKSFTTTLDRFSGSNIASNVAVGFFEINGATLGTKIFDDEIFTSYDPNNGFKFSGNISTEEVYTPNTLLVDGGLRSYNFSDYVTKNIKTDKFFSPDSNDHIHFSNAKLLTIGDVQLNLNVEGEYYEPTISTITDSVNKPLIIAVHANRGDKFLFSNVNLDMNDFSFRTNVTQNNYTNHVGAGSGYTAGDATFARGGKVNIGVSAGAINSVTMVDHGYGYKEGDVVDVDGGTGGTFNYRLGDRNKTLDQYDRLNHISIDGDQEINNGYTMASVGTDFSIKYYTQGAWSNTVGGSNVMINRPGFNTSRITLTDSGSHFFFKTTYAGKHQYTPNFWASPIHGRKLLYKCDYSSAPDVISNVTVSDGIPVNWGAETDTLSLYSNCDINTSYDVNVATTVIGSETYVTPLGSRFLRCHIDYISSDSNDWRLDGSFIPLVSITSNSRNTVITYGAVQSNTVNYLDNAINIFQESSGVNFTVNTGGRLIIDYAPGGNPPTVAQMDTFLGFCKVGHQPGELYSNKQSMYTGVISSPRPGGAAGGGVPNLLLMSNLYGTQTTLSQSFVEDYEFKNALLNGGLIIEFFSEATKNMWVTLSNPTIDVYRNTTRISNIPQYSNVTTIDFNLDNTTVKVDNGDFSCTFTSFTTSEVVSMIKDSKPHIYPRNDIVGQYLVFRAYGSKLNNDVRSNIYLESTTFENTTQIVESNGYANVISGSFVEGPIPVQRKQLDFRFIANSYSNACYFVNEYLEFSPNVSETAILDFIDPYKNGVVLNSNGNVFTYVTNNYAEFFENNSNIFPLDGTNQFDKNGYFIKFDGSGTAFQDVIGNVITVNKLSNVLMTNTFTTYTNPSPSNNYVQVYTGNAWITSPSQTYTGDVKRQYPFSPRMITISTSNRLNISYDPDDNFRNKISLLPPHDFTTTAVGNINAWFNTTYEVYSGPTQTQVNTDTLQTYFTNSDYSTNVFYTRGKFTNFLNGTEIISQTFKTYSTDTNIDFYTYSNVVKQDTNSYIITETDTYDKFLRSNTILYNSNIDLGTITVSVNSEITLGDSAYFGYESNIYILGGNNTDECYRCSSNVYGGQPTPVGLKSFLFGFNNGTATLDTDNNYVYLFAPNNSKNLYRIKFNPTTREFDGEWELESTSYWFSSIISPGINYYNNKLFVLTGYIPYYGYTNNYAYIDYYDLQTRTWKDINISYGMRRVSAPQLASGNLIYFGGSDGPATSSVDNNAFYVYDADASTVTKCTESSNVLVQSLNYAQMGLYAQGPIERVFIFDSESIGTSRIQFIDRGGTPAFIRDSITTTNGVVMQDVDGSLVVPVDQTYGGLTSFGGYNGTGYISNIFSFSPGNTTFYDPAFNFIYQSTLFNDSNYVGAVSPGNVPVVKTGIRFSSEDVKLFRITDSTTLDKQLQFGFTRSNVFTSLPNGSTRENKGVFNTWYVNELDQNTNVINIGWDGKDDYNNFTQNGVVGYGPIWPADSVNDSGAVANFYSSNITFTSTEGTGLSNVLFRTSSVKTSGFNSRSNLVPNQIAGTNVKYSNFTYTANNFFNFTVNGISRYDNPNTSSITVFNQFNDFVKKDFDKYPDIEVCYSTDNSPVIQWKFTEPDNNAGIKPPSGVSISNAMITDVYRQYQSSQIKNKTGRLEEVRFFYGTSRYTKPSSESVAAKTDKYGIYRGEVANVTMAPRKMTMCGFSSTDSENIPTNQIQIYKYYSSNSNPTSALIGDEDRIYVTFGSGTTSNSTTQSVFIQPGLGTSPPTPANITNGTNPDDKVTIRFKNYDSNNLSVNVSISYQPISSSVPSVSNSIIVNLNSTYFNFLSDSYGRSGSYTIRTAYNNGIISSPEDIGYRPTTVSFPNGNSFSQNLLSTCLSSFIFVDHTNDSNIAQENVFNSSLPVEIDIRKYDSNGIYTDKLGRAMIKEARLYLDGQLIQRNDDLSYIIKDELFRNKNEKDTLKYLINGGQDYLPSSQLASGPFDMYIPLEFFFSRTHKTSSLDLTPKTTHEENRSMRPYLPLCALGDKDMMVEIDFYPRQYFSNTSIAIDLSYLDTAIITDEIMVTDKERLYYRYKPQEIIIENIDKLPLQNLNLKTPGIEQRFNGLVSDVPVKMLMWLFRSNQFSNENDPTEFLHRYNFSTVRSEREDYKLFFEFMKDAQMFIDGTPQIQRFGTNDFFRYLQAIQGGLTSTSKNIYTYAFSLNPTKVTPSGSFNMTSTSSNRTFLTFNIAPREQSSAIEQIDLNLGATIHSYAIGYNVLKLENGFVTRIFS